MHAGEIPKHLTGAILDLDGVVLDTMRQWSSLGFDYLVDCGIKPNFNLMERIASMTLEESSAFLHDEYFIQKSADEIYLELQKRFFSFYTPCPQVKDGVLETLQSLKKLGVKIVLATTTPRLCAESGLKAANLRSFFDKIFSCDDMNIIEGKKSTRIYDAALEYLKTPVDETIVVEDSLYAALSAKKGGYFVVGFEDEAEKDHKMEFILTADVYFENHSQFQAWLVSNFSKG